MRPGLSTGNPPSLSAPPSLASPPLAPFPQEAREEQMGTVSSSLGLQMGNWGWRREEGSWRAEFLTQALAEPQARPHTLFSRSLPAPGETQGQSGPGAWAAASASNMRVKVRAEDPQAS